jgi:hypothetical protein
LQAKDQDYNQPEVKYCPCFDMAMPILKWKCPYSDGQASCIILTVLVLFLQSAKEAKKKKHDSTDGEEDGSDAPKKKKAKPAVKPAAKAKPPAARKPKAVGTAIAMTGLVGSINSAVSPAKVHMPVWSTL